MEPVHVDLAAPAMLTPSAALPSDAHSGAKRLRDDSISGDAKRLAPDLLSGTASGDTRESFVAVQNEHVGRVIGKQGATLRVFQSLSGAQVDVPPECEPGTNVRHIRIRGNDVALAYVTELILQKCDPARASQALVLPADGSVITRVVMIPDQHVGRVIGRSGETVRQLQDQTSCHVDVAIASAAGQMPPTRAITLTGTPKQIAIAEAMIQRKVAGDDMPFGAMGGAMGMGGMGMGGMLGGAPGGGMSIAPKFTAEGMKAYIPDDMVGRIIGKQGATIREIQDMSGAHVDIAKTTPPGQTHRELTISGAPAQMAYCNLLVQGKICDQNTSAPAYQEAYQHYSRVYAQTQGGGGGAPGGQPAPGGYGGAPAGGGYGAPHAAPYGYGAAPSGYGAPPAAAGYGGAQAGGYPGAAAAGYGAPPSGYGAPGGAPAYGAPAGGGYGAPAAPAVDPYANYYQQQQAAAPQPQAGAPGADAYAAYYQQQAAQYGAAQPQAAQPGYGAAPYGFGR